MAGTQNKLVKAIKMVNNWNCTRLTSPIYRWLTIFIECIYRYMWILLYNNDKR